MSANSSAAVSRYSADSSPATARRGDTRVPAAANSVRRTPHLAGLIGAQALAPLRPGTARGTLVELLRLP
ncbi:hypothetical protein [Nocardia sp. NPDC051463]|uniref:hypothetical protein n=1 Tax=Nocardia sp. NPDC051463 TaxID=3154845 RepID=UPI0034372128